MARSRSRWLGSRSNLLQRDLNLILSFALFLCKPPTVNDIALGNAEEFVKRAEDLDDSWFTRAEEVLEIMEKAFGPLPNNLDDQYVDENGTEVQVYEQLTFSDFAFYKIFIANYLKGRSSGAPNSAGAVAYARMMEGEQIWPPKEWAGAVRSRVATQVKTEVFNELLTGLAGNPNKFSFVTSQGISKLFSFVETGGKNNKIVQKAAEVGREMSSETDGGEKGKDEKGRSKESGEAKSGAVKGKEGRATTEKGESDEGGEDSHQSDQESSREEGEGDDEKIGEGAKTRANRKNKGGGGK